MRLATFRSVRRTGASIFALLALGVLLTGCAAPNSPDYNREATFRTPEQAVTTLASAAKTGDAKELQSIFGGDAHEILASGDPVADHANREVFSIAINEHWSLHEVDSETRELRIGHENWPFPIPLVKDGRGWWFNTLAGKEEILARRIGRNELAAIGAMMAYADAQREYAASPHDGRPAGAYAQKIRSDPGTQNGLYWELTPGQPASPFAQLATAAAAEGYSTQAAGKRAYHGYHFRILTRQGASAPGGAHDWVSNGDMTGGFGMIAWPAEYRNSGVMSFLVGPDGVILERDLGVQTPTIAAGMTEFAPDSNWRPVK